ncbi:MAG TPA: aconitate hydratase AcnA, partial [Chthonomonadales bacterium]|nr:aconitate hydratase AcnA [Chthonomonadales bacterium]
MSANSFGAAGRLASCGREYTYYRLSALDAHGVSVARLPYCIRILLENLLRHEDGVTVTADHILAVARWDPTADPSSEIAFTPARVLLQDFTGVPCVVDLAAMRQAVVDLGGDPSRVSPLQPVELVIDHSVHVDAYGSGDALSQNTRLEYERNRERYSFLKWGQKAFDNFRVVPPNTGIVHQVNLEHLARVVCAQGEDSAPVAFPDTLVGTDSHTTMVNGLGVLGWGVGGIEAEAAMLGQPISMLVPQVVGFRLMGALCEGATATDLVLTVTEMLRRHGVVGRFVEFFGPGLAGMPLADRATLANMAPEYGATCGIFPIDHETIAYLRLTGRTEEQVDLVERYARAQGLYADADAPEATYSAVVELDLRSVETSIAGPRRPHDRIPLSRAAASFREALPAIAGPAAVRPGAVHVSGVPVELDGKAFTLNHGAVVIAAITSCANTSNPSVMLAAGLLAQKAVDRGVRRKPWVKTSLAPGSRVVTKYLDEAGVLPFLELVGFNLVGYGCTTCIGNSGPLPRPI